MAIDYGARRIGIAVSDPRKLLLQVWQPFLLPIFKFILEYIKTEQIDKIVIGESKHLDNTKTDIAIEIEKFAVKIKSMVPKASIHWVDERLISQWQRLRC